MLSRALADVWRRLPHQQPLRWTPPVYEIFWDVCFKELATVTPTSTVVVHHARTNIYHQETLALLLAALATPPGSLLRCDDHGLVNAVRKGHAHTIPWAAALSFFVLFVTKRLTIKWVPSVVNPADAPSRLPLRRSPCGDQCGRALIF